MGGLTGLIGCSGLSGLVGVGVCELDFEEWDAGESPEPMAWFCQGCEFEEWDGDEQPVGLV